MKTRMLASKEGFDDLVPVKAMFTACGQDLWETTVFQRMILRTATVGGEQGIRRTFAQSLITHHAVEEAPDVLRCSDGHKPIQLIFGLVGEVAIEQRISRPVLYQCVRMSIGRVKSRSMQMPLLAVLGKSKLFALEHLLDAARRRLA